MHICELICAATHPQLEGSGRGALGSYNEGAYQELSSFLAEQPIKNGDEWVAQLMRRNSMLGECMAQEGSTDCMVEVFLHLHSSVSGLRVLEVRLAYCNEDFEFDQLEKLARCERWACKRFQMSSPSYLRGVPSSIATGRICRTPTSL